MRFNEGRDVIEVKGPKERESWGNGGWVNRRNEGWRSIESEG